MSKVLYRGALNPISRAPANQQAPKFTIPLHYTTGLQSRGFGLGTCGRATSGWYFDPSTGYLTEAESTEARIEAKGLLVEPASTNYCLRNRAFTTSPWQNTGCTTAQNETGIDGSANTAWTLTDDSSEASEHIYQDISVDDDTKTHCVSLFFKKTKTAVTFPGLRCRYITGSAISGDVIVNTNTGVLIDRPTGAAYTPSYKGIDDYGDWWRVYVCRTNDGSGNTTCRIEVRPAISTDGVTWTGESVQGSCIVDYGQFEKDRVFPTSPIPTTASSVTRNTEAGEYTWPIPTGVSDLLRETQTLSFSATVQTGSFTVGNTVYGAASGAHGTISQVGVGWIIVHTITGTFEADEVIYEATYGSELVTNGDFSADSNWTKGTGWTIAAGKATHATGSTSQIYQDISAVSGSFYRFVYTTSGISAGGMQAMVGDEAGVSRTTNDTWTEYIQCDGADSNAKVQAGSACDGSIDDISVKQITNAALTTSVSSKATEGTLVFLLTPGFSESIVATNGTSFVSSANSNSSLSSIDLNGTLYTYDHSTYCYGTNFSFVRGQVIPVVVRWGYDDSGTKYEVGYKDSTGSWDWGTQQSFDGSFNDDGTLCIGRSVYYPFHIQNIHFYDLLTQAEVEAMI